MTRTKTQCLGAAAEIYASILADPARAEQLRDARETPQTRTGHVETRDDRRTA